MLIVLYIYRIMKDNKSNNNGDHIDNEQTFNNLFLPYYKQVIQFGFYIHNIYIISHRIMNITEAIITSFFYCRLLF